MFPLCPGYALKSVFCILYLRLSSEKLKWSLAPLLEWILAFLQVDLHGICSMVPLPLNQGVLLALLQQLTCDIGNDTSRKLAWMTDVAAAINPADPIIALHVRPIFEQVYNMLAHQRTLASMTTAEASSIRLIMHVINSVLLSCKWTPFILICKDHGDCLSVGTILYIEM